MPPLVLVLSIAAVACTGAGLISALISARRPRNLRIRTGQRDTLVCMTILEQHLRKLPAKWISLGRHPSRALMPEVREAYERCARDLHDAIHDAHVEEAALHDGEVTQAVEDTRRGGHAELRSVKDTPE